MQLPYKHSWQDTGKIQVIKKIQGNVRDKAGQQNMQGRKWNNTLYGHNISF